MIQQKLNRTPSILGWLGSALYRLTNPDGITEWRFSSAHILCSFLLAPPLGPSRACVSCAVRPLCSSQLCERRALIGPLSLHMDRVTLGERRSTPMESYDGLKPGQRVCSVQLLLIILPCLLSVQIKIIIKTHIIQTRAV